MLYVRYGQKRVIVLVDEYDAPLNCAFRKGFYDEASSFFASFFSRALKDNAYLKQACLMGIVEVRGADILSTLNNIYVCSVDKIDFSEHFGFSVQEVSDFFEDKNDSTIASVLAWYDGYTIGISTVINPWSFLNFIEIRQLKSFWIDTAYTATIRSMLQPRIKELLLVTFQLLFEPEPVIVPLLSSKFHYSSSLTPVSVLHFLVHTGYLTYCVSDNGVTGTVRIPNHEVREHWREHVVQLVTDTVFSTESKSQVRLKESLQTNIFSKVKLGKIMRDLLYASASFLDLISENSYHSFFLGCFKVAFDKEKNVSVKSNRESGSGRFDISIMFYDLRRYFIFEFKKVNQVSHLERAAQNALSQITEMDYAQESKDCQCILIGISFCQKIMSNLRIRILNTISAEEGAAPAPEPEPVGVRSSRPCRTLPAPPPRKRGG
jgi:hypothetical protein